MTKMNIDDVIVAVFLDRQHDGLVGVKGEGDQAAVGGGVGGEGQEAGRALQGEEQRARAPGVEPYDYEIYLNPWKHIE